MKKFVRIAAIVTGFSALSLAFGAGAVRNVRADIVSPPSPAPAPEAQFVVPVAAQQSGAWSVSLQGTPTVNVAALPSISGNVGIAPGTVLVVTPHVVPYIHTYGNSNGFGDTTVSTGGKLFVVEHMSGFMILPFPPGAPLSGAIQIGSATLGFQSINVLPGFPDVTYTSGQTYDYSQPIRLYFRDGDSVYFQNGVGAIPEGWQLTLVGYLVDP